MIFPLAVTEDTVGLSLSHHRLGTWDFNLMMVQRVHCCYALSPIGLLALHPPLSPSSIVVAPAPVVVALLC